MIELTEQQKRVIRAFIERGEPTPVACGCMGARDNEPFCSCAMRWIMIDEGHYFRIGKVQEDLGYTYSAENIGPVGGPYTIDTDQWEKAIWLVDVGERKISAIKVIRETRPDLGLVEAKTLSENLPAVIMKGITRKYADEIADKFRAIGATVRVG